MLTGYLLAAAVATPIAGRLGDMLGKRRLFVASLLVFAAGNAVAALGDTLEVVVAGRVLQGIGGGIIPLAISIIRDEFPAERVPGSIGLISAIFGIGGGLGLVLGGVVTDALSYHWIFWMGAVVAALAALAAQLFVPESPVRTPGRVDVRGAALLAAGLVPPLFAISRANEWGWGSARTLGLIAAGVAVLAVFVAVERRTAEPLADVRALSAPPVLMTNITTLLVGFGMFGSFMLIPQLAETPPASGYGFGLDATGAGLLLLPGSLVMLFAGPVSGFLGGRFGSKVPLAIGAVVTGAGLFLLGLVPCLGGGGRRVQRDHVRRLRARVRRDPQPDRLRGPARPDRRGDRGQHARALRRRLARHPGHGGDHRRDRGRRQPAPDRGRLRRRLPAVRRRRRARGPRRHADPARGRAGAPARARGARAPRASRAYAGER